MYGAHVDWRSGSVPDQRSYWAELRVPLRQVPLAEARSNVLATLAARAIVPRAWGSAR
jgi:hypothetical protein